MRCDNYQQVHGRHTLTIGIILFYQELDILLCWVHAHCPEHLYDLACQNRTIIVLVEQAEHFLHLWKQSKYIDAMEPVI